MRKETHANINDVTIQDMVGHTWIPTGVIVSEQNRIDKYILYSDTLKRYVALGCRDIVKQLNKQIDIRGVTITQETIKLGAYFKNIPIYYQDDREATDTLVIINKTKKSEQEPKFIKFGVLDMLGNTYDISREQLIEDIKSGINVVGARLNNKLLKVQSDLDTINLSKEGRNTIEH